jgi:hypothetical protein
VKTAVGTKRSQGVQQKKNHSSSSPSRFLIKNANNRNKEISESAHVTPEHADQSIDS